MGILPLATGISELAAALHEETVLGRWMRWGGGSMSGRSLPSSRMAVVSVGGGEVAGWWVEKGKRVGGVRVPIGRGPSFQKGGVLFSGGLGGVAGAAGFVRLGSSGVVWLVYSKVFRGGKLALTEESLVNDGFHGGWHLRMCRMRS